MIEEIHGFAVWRGAERRSIERTRIRKDALLFVAGQIIAQPCRVRDISESGVGLHLNGLAILPMTFELSFDGPPPNLEMQACLARWRLHRRKMEPGLRNRPWPQR